MVVTSRFAARNAGTRQLCTGFPSSQTVQAPQSPASQPFFTPNQPRLRTKVLKHWPGRGSASKSFPLIVYFIRKASVRKLLPNLLGKIVGQMLAMAGRAMDVVEVEVKRRRVV
jgi:hypothetical protein